MGSHETRVSFLSCFAPETVVISTEFFVIVATSPSCIIITLDVYLMIAGISDEIKFSFSPRPIIKGLPFLATTIFPGALLCITPTA